MEATKFHEICKINGYNFNYKDGITYVTDSHHNLYFNTKTLPENVVFRNTYTVNLPNLEELPLSVFFENIYDVVLGKDTKIPNNYSGFNNRGRVLPENPKYLRHKYYISDDFYAFLVENQKYPYFSDLIKLQNNFIKDGFAVSYISYNDGMISFLPVRNVSKEYFANKKEGDNFENYCYKNRVKFIIEGQKYSVKIGRFIQKMFPKMTDVEAETFVNICKNFKTDDDYEFVIFTGEDIRRYYNTEKQEIKNGTRIFNSCMNWTTGEEVHRINGLPIIRLLDFYVENPNCGLLVLKYKTEDKIVGRALIWTTEDGRKYIEMNYVNKDSQDYLFNKYAALNKCLSYNNGDRGFTIKCPDAIKELKVLPTYLDSLVFNKDKNIISR